LLQELDHTEERQRPVSGYNKTTMPPVRAVFFDIGDTLVFDDPPLRGRFGAALLAAGVSHSPRRLLEAFRAGEECALTHYLSGQPWEEVSVMRESADATMAALGLPPLSEREWQAVLHAFLQITPTRRVHSEAIPLLEELHRRGFVLGAISDWEETLPELLAEWELAPHLDALAVSAIVVVTKPHAALFQDALRQANAAPETALHVGDWYALDVAGARAVGMQTLLFDHAGRTPEADCPRVQTFAEMRDYLLALPAPL
jgi:FMN phosphatase YigB (HAD superfamily)